MSMRIFSRSISTFNPVKIDYQDLISNANLDKKIEEGFGPDGLGIITIANIPGYQEKRTAVLPLARRLALLSDAEKAEIEFPQVSYSIGWSHGKESYEGKPDFSKGSYYANPEVDDAPVSEGNYHANAWPNSIPQLRPAFKGLGGEIMRVGALLGKHLDKYIKNKHPGYKDGTIEDLVLNHKSTIARLLHYFPQEGSDQPWCGWHNDHSPLTGLTCPLYLNQTTGDVVSASEVADERTGLFVKSRKGESLKAKVTNDLLIFQIGETSQIISNGWLQATPHAVMTTGLHPNISRNTLAVFMGPRPDLKLEVAEDYERIFVEHEGVPSLRRRFKKGMTFGDFHNATVGHFHQ